MRWKVTKKMNPDPFECERQNALLKTAILLFAAALLFALCSHAPIARAQGDDLSFYWTAPREEYARKIEAFLADYFARCSPRKLIAARKVAPVLLDVAEREKVNPIIIAAVITHESTWNYSATGALGEVGLMQVNNISRTDDPAEQLTIGIGVLRGAFERCGAVENAISLYATGKSCRTYKGAKLRMKTARRINAY